MLDKFGQFRRARARRGLPRRAARTTPIDFASPSPSRASPAGQSRRPQAAASPKGVRKMEATTDQIATIAALNDIAVEQHRQARARKAGLVTSMGQGRTEMPLRDNEAPKQAWTSGLDIQKAFHRCPLKKGLSQGRDLSGAATGGAAAWPAWPSGIGWSAHGGSDRASERTSEASIAPATDRRTTCERTARSRDRTPRSY